MKFMDLDMGQQFELEGEIFVRTGPLVAVHAESGKQRFMARYLVVKPSGAAPNAAPRKPDMLSSDTVNKAFEIFHTQCQDILLQLEATLQPDRVNMIRAQLKQARQDFLEALNGK